MKYVKWVTVIFLIAAGLAGAAQTFTDTYNRDNNVPLWAQGSNKWAGDHPSGWNNGFNRGRSIIEATMTIEGLGVENVCWQFDNSNHQKANDQYNGLVGLKGGFLMRHEPRPNLLSYQALIQSVSNASSGSSFRGYSYGKMPVYHPSEEGPDGPIPMPSPQNEPFGPFIPKEPSIPLATVPTPSAIVMGSIGIILVGWLRKRSCV